MTLPKIDQPVVKIEIPSTKKPASFRPFLVKEEKILLMAKDSEDPADILLAIKQIVNNCSLDATVNISTLTIFDLEYIYLKLRAVSVNNIINVVIRDYDDNTDHNLEINLNDVKVEFPENINKKIEITKKAGLIMKYPLATLYEDKEYLNLQDDYLFALMVRCVDKIYDGDSDAQAYATQWDGAYMASFEPQDIASLKRMQEILLATGADMNGGILLKLYILSKLCNNSK